MFFEIIPEFRNSLSLRLSLWYALIFTLTSLLTLSIFFYVIHAAFMRNMDESLQEELHEMDMMLKTGGIEEVEAYMDLEIQTENGETFYRLFSSGGHMISEKSNFRWKNLLLPEISPPASAELTHPEFQTLAVRGYPHRLRTAYGRIGPSERMQVGKSMAEIDKYSYVFRNLMILIVFPLVGISVLIGWWMARRALSGVEEISETAIEISKGSYDKRVRVHQRADEITRLANAFNVMLDRLQAVIASMGEMTDNIAHDLRSPLARIRGIAEMTLINRATLGDYRTMAINTIEECDGLIHMINTMLDITEMDAGVGALNMETVDLAGMVYDACELFKPLADERDIRIEADTGNRPLMYTTDRRKLQRLVTNLLENAIKFSHPGGVVTVSVQPDPRHIRLMFKDTGIGIPGAEIDKIFDRFYRCDRSRSCSGIGLGLSLARSIAGALGGDISVKSVENQGSTFTVVLPV